MAANNINTDSIGLIEPLTDISRDEMHPLGQEKRAKVTTGISAKGIRAGPLNTAKGLGKSNGVLGGIARSGCAKSDDSVREGARDDSIAIAQDAHDTVTIGMDEPKGGNAERLCGDGGRKEREKERGEERAEHCGVRCCATRRCGRRSTIACGADGALSGGAVTWF